MTAPGESGSGDGGGLLLRASPRIEMRRLESGKRLTDVETGRFLVPVRLSTERLIYLMQLRHPDGRVFAEARIRLAGIGGPAPEPYPVEFLGIDVINGRDPDEAEPAIRAEVTELLFEILPLSPQYRRNGQLCSRT